MLKNFIYLNQPTLDSYLSALEDGSRTKVESQKSTNEAVSGGAGIKVPVVDLKLGVDAEHGTGSSETTSRIDTPEARFERLLKLAHADADASDWIEAINPDTDLSAARIGTMVELECEVYIPDMIKMLSPGGGIGELVNTIESFAKIAPAFGTNIANMPSSDQLGAVKSAVGLLGSDSAFVGEPTGGDSDWKVSGKLLHQHVRGEVEGYARVIGKVSAIVGTGKWVPLLAMPGMNALPREQRREMERKGPEAGQEQNWVKGPALLLDVLAIYR